MKKTTTLLFSLLCIAIGGFSQTTFPVDGIIYRIIAGTNTVEIAGSFNYNGAAIIPTEVTNNSQTYTVTAIAAEAFRGSVGLTAITTPSTLTAIGNNAFESCTGLTSVTMSDNVTSIGGWAFYSCPQLASITIPEGVTTIGMGTFQYCTGLTSVTFGSKMESIGNGAFLGCANLNSITIPNSIKTIGSTVFYECTGLTSVTIGSNMESIGNRAFWGCSNLASVTSLNPTPPKLGSVVFDGVDRTTCILYVPEDSQTAYKGAAQWQAFNIITPISASSVSTISIGAARVYAVAGTLYVEGVAEPYTIHAITGAELYRGTAPNVTLPVGIYVVNIGKERRKVVVR